MQCFYSEPCGNYLNGSGAIKSPGFPYKYRNDIECVYKILVEEQSIIKIVFIEFDLEHRGDCTNDFLEFNDGDSEFSSLLGKFCGSASNIPNILYSTQNKLYMR